MRMRKNLLRAGGLVVLASLGLAIGAQAQEKPAHKYIGATKCSVCHKAEAKGNQYGAWMKSAHAKAFETLASEKALAIGKEKGIAKPQESDACLKCHVTGHGKAAALFEPTFKKEEGVSCESCHGAGSDYKAMNVMKDLAAAKAAGLVIPDEKTCTACHNTESPTFKPPFDFKAMAAKVAHPNPAKVKKS